MSVLQYLTLPGFYAASKAAAASSKDCIPAPLQHYGCKGDRNDSAKYFVHNCFNLVCQTVLTLETEYNLLVLWCNFRLRLVPQQDYFRN